MSRLVAIVPSLGASPFEPEQLAALRAELAGFADARLVWVQQGAAPPPALDPGREQLVALPRPAGFAAAMNAGYAAAPATVELVAVVNDDAIVEPGWLTALAAELERRPEVAAVQGTNLDLARPERLDGCGLGWNRDWQAVQLGHGAPTASYVSPGEPFGVSATASLYRASALRAVAHVEAPLFDARLGSYYEDVELAVRLRAAGFESRSMPRARVRHAGQATTGRAPRARFRQLYRNRRWVVAALLGERYARERARIVHRDRRDLVRRLLALDLPAALGILEGLAAARAPNPLLTGDAGQHPPAHARALAAAERLAVSSET